MLKTENIIHNSLQTQLKTVSVCIVNWNTKDYLKSCLLSLIGTEESVAFEVIVVDNCSADGSADMVRECFPQVKLIVNSSNEGYAKANNQAIEQAGGEYILFLNPDTEIPSGIFERLIDKIESDPAIGVLSCQLRNFDGSVQNFCSGLPTIYDEIFLQTGFDRLYPYHPWAGHRNMSYFDCASENVVEQPPGTFLFTRRQVIDRIGGFDVLFPVFYNDVDWCKRVIEAGWNIVFTPAVYIYHHKSASLRDDLARHLKDAYYMRQRYYRKHFGKLTTAVLRFFAPFRSTGLKKDQADIKYVPKRVLLIKSSFENHFMHALDDVKQMFPDAAIDILTTKHGDQSSLRKKCARVLLYSGIRRDIYYFQTRKLVRRMLNAQKYDTILFTHATVDGAGYWNVIFFCSLLCPQRIGAFGVDGRWRFFRPWSAIQLRGLISYATAYLLLGIEFCSRLIKKLRRTNGSRRVGLHR